jgi:hypothetical protein
MRPDATRKLVHPVERITKENQCGAGASSLEPMALELAVQTPLKMWRRCGGLRQPAEAGGGLPRSSAAAPQPCADDPGRQLPAEGEAAQRLDPPAGGRFLLTGQRWPTATAAR